MCVWWAQFLWLPIANLALRVLSASPFVITSLLSFGLFTGQLGEATPRLRGSWEPENRLRKSRARASGIRYFHLHY